MDIIKFSHKLIEYDYNTKKYNDLLKFIFSHQLSNFKIKKIVKKNIKLNNNLIGGGSNSADSADLEADEINDNIYIVRLVHGDSTDIKGKTHTIKFISIDDLNEKSLFCAILNFDYELKIAYLQGIGDYINCVLCANRLNEYKVAQILMNIILHLCKEKKPKIKYIELQDNSTLKCMKTYKPNPNLEWNNKYQNHDSMLLNILRTLQFGEPYYLKYGFKPKDEDIDVYLHNLKIFNENKLLNTINIKKIINKKISNDKHIEVYDKFIIPLINDYENKPVSKFINKLLDINIDPYIKSVICYILSKIYVDIFDKVGYKKYSKAIFKKKL